MTNMSAKGLEAKKPTMDDPMRKCLPTLRHMTVGMRCKNEEDKETLTRSQDK